jgi:predicted nucleic acid-binding Zn ribbon protein
MTSPAAALRAMRPVRIYTCCQCGKVFTASDERARYCSNRCRQAVKYRRMKERRDR